MRPYCQPSSKGAGNAPAPLSMSVGLRLLLSAGEFFLPGFLTLLHLFWCQVFNVRGQSPLVAERIDHLSEAIAPEHVSHGHRACSTSLDRALIPLVDIIDVRVKRDRGSAQGERAFTVHARTL